MPFKLEGDRKRLDCETMRFREMYKDVKVEENQQKHMINSLLGFIQELITNNPEVWQDPPKHPTPWWEGKY